MKTLTRIILITLPAGFILSACEGPMGPAGMDANETCKECHNSEVVQQKAAEFEFSKHRFGLAAFDEAGNTTCSPCHTSEAFKYVSKNNIPATFTLNATTGKYRNDYVTTSSTAFGIFNCFTCHDNLHETFTYDDFFPVTTTAPVPLTMWKGALTINLTQDDSISNLCIKCHQPRPLTTSATLSTGDVVNYAGLVSSPTAVFYNSAVGNAAPNTVIPSYRTHVHYGTAGAIFAGMGGIQYQGTIPYTNSAHTTLASCVDCHMAPIDGRAGGHTFYASTNLNSCNVTGCHSNLTASPASPSYTALWTNPRNEIRTLLNTLATRINAVGGGVDVLHSDPDAEHNLWAGRTTNNYDGYLNIYDPATNPAGVWRNPAPAGSWTDANRATNNALTVFPTLLNVHMGAMINFQMVLRDFSLGIHNFDYSKALLQNSIEALTAAGV